MSAHDEYLHLPKGMFDREEAWIEQRNDILSFHKQYGRENGCSIVEISSVEHASTFTKASSNIDTNKVYNFLDKSERELYLSCDSMPGVLRHYCATQPNKVSSRLSFIAPIFRYRHRPIRNFTQIGYSIINESSPKSFIDINLIQLIDAIVKICSSLKIKTKIYLNDFAFLRKKLLGGGIKFQHLPEVLHQLQFAKFSDRKKFLLEKLDANAYNEVIPLFTSGQSCISNNLCSMADAISKYVGVPVHIDTTNLSSIEIISGYAVRFMSISGERLGDGGRYDEYGSKFNANVKTFCSVATSIESLMRCFTSQIKKREDRKLFVLNIDASDSFIIDALKAFKEQGYCITYGGYTSNIKKDILRAIKSSFTHIGLIGKNEETTNTLQVKNLTDKTTQKFEITTFNGSVANFS